MQLPKEALQLAFLEARTLFARAGPATVLAFAACYESLVRNVAFTAGVSVGIRWLIWGKACFSLVANTPSDPVSLWIGKLFAVGSSVALPSMSAWSSGALLTAQFRYASRKV